MFCESNKQVSSRFCISKWPISGSRTRLTKHRRKVIQWHLILVAMYTTMWLEIDCWLAEIVDWLFRTCSVKNMILESSNALFCFGVTQKINRECAKPFCFLFSDFWLSFAPGLTCTIPQDIMDLEWWLCCNGEHTKCYWEDENHCPLFSLVGLCWNDHFDNGVINDSIYAVDSFHIFANFRRTFNSIL